MVSISHEYFGIGPKCSGSCGKIHYKPHKHKVCSFAFKFALSGNTYSPCNNLDCSRWPCYEHRNQTLLKIGILKHGACPLLWVSNREIKGWLHIEGHPSLYEHDIGNDVFSSHYFSYDRFIQSVIPMCNLPVQLYVVLPLRSRKYQVASESETADFKMLFGPPHKGGLSCEIAPFLTGKQDLIDGELESPSDACKREHGEEIGLDTASIIPLTEGPIGIQKWDRPEHVSCSFFLSILDSNPPKTRVGKNESDKTTRICCIPLVTDPSIVLQRKRTLPGKEGYAVLVLKLRDYIRYLVSFHQFINSP
jgi:hypothetical protein